MPAPTIVKNLNLCFTKTKWPLNLQSSPTQPNPDDQGRPFRSSATNSSTLIKTFNSVYDYNAGLDLRYDVVRTNNYNFPPEPESDTEPDFATVFASQRFFFASPGRSNSIIESSPSIREEDTESSSTSDTECDLDLRETTVKGSVAVPTYSPDPYADFRKSMEEMVEARELKDAKGKWEYLQELLVCYLALNPKSAHKFITGAFADVIVTLMSSPEENQRSSTKV
ncbi:transcription repressor OFP12-like [Carica papaya]|uniref:transcription repressor OFP12-like n=1 Tax=Carica papaya TaxID=3649 RepID=UPI000B8CDEE4|nr:transcription repressor OFP12-like [Carica papaya]